MQPKRQGRPPTIANARGRILEEAAAQFAREGYEGTSMDDIAESVGVTKAGVYHYFPNKKEIYEAIIVKTLEGLLRSVSAAIAQARDPEAALGTFMTAHADYFEEHHDAFLTMLVAFGGMQNVVMIAEAQKLRDDYEALLRNIIADGVSDGTFRQVDVRTSSRAVLSMLNWMARWFKPGHGRRASDFAKDYCDLLLGGIRT
ncbi:TetR/AcrR family transcriptional regulator [Microvirga puerhi]|uniref:TetR/AcrR family transcriptional regulator n=1 Tax=Microvirga puerhi TaxID=2876078 RepID=A0ABS7VSQ9_9HYPH|nr:TetR/AcrR family transcriptional regulator [Microvirga puerhi]MBZ6078234.1 TetR/AcrR family transcriptional regulator [Microvirga puerhi]